MAGRDEWFVDLIGSYHYAGVGIITSNSKNYATMTRKK